MGNFMPAVCRLRTPSTCRAPSQPVRSLRIRRCSAGVSAISSAQTTSPSRSSQPDRMAAEATGRPVALRLTCPPHVEANGQAQAQDEEEGQPRQEAELRPRLTRSSSGPSDPSQAAPAASNTEQSVVGTSEMIPSTPRPSKRYIDSVSFTVHTWTAFPAAWAPATKRSSTTTRSPWRSGTW